MITEASIVNPRTVLMQWSPPPPEDHNGVITKYIVNITSQNTASYQQVNVTGTSAVITDLVASFTYYLSVSAHTVDTGPYSSYVVITLPQDGKICLLLDCCIHLLVKVLSYAYCIKFIADSNNCEYLHNKFVSFYDTEV